MTEQHHQKRIEHLVYIRRGGGAIHEPAQDMIDRAYAAPLLFPAHYDEGQLRCRAERLGISCGMRPQGVCARLWGAFVTVWTRGRWQ